VLPAHPCAMRRNGAVPFEPDPPTEPTIMATTSASPAARLPSLDLVPRLRQAGSPGTVSDSLPVKQTT